MDPIDMLGQSRVIFDDSRAKRTQYWLSLGGHGKVV